MFKHEYYCVNYQGVVVGCGSYWINSSMTQGKVEKCPVCGNKIVGQPRAEEPS